MPHAPQPLALVVSTDALRFDAGCKTFRGRLSVIDPSFWVFHQAHYRGFGLRSARTGKVLRFYIDRMHYSRRPSAPGHNGPHAYTLRPTQEALDVCPVLAGARMVLTDDTEGWTRLPGAKRKAAALADARAREARLAGDLTAAQAYAEAAMVMARHAACPGV